IGAARRSCRPMGSESVPGPDLSRKLDLPDLNLRHLRALLLIVERGSVSSAARKLGISQPALTRAIGKLEQMLGAILFVRLSDGMNPTVIGREVAERFRRAMTALAQSAKEIGGSAGRGFERPDHMMTGSQLGSLISLSNEGNFADASQATGLSERT